MIIFNIFIPIDDINKFLKVSSQLECIANIAYNTTVVNAKSFLGLNMIVNKHSQLILPNGIESSDDFYVIEKIINNWGITKEEQTNENN